MDARIIKTKQKIKDALLSLLHSKKVGKISISELCKKANINRNTFYTHYATPEAVLMEIANELSDEMFAIIAKCESRAQIALAVCQYTYSHVDTYRIIMQNDGQNVYLKPAIRYSKNITLYKLDNSPAKFTQEQLDMIDEFLLNGTIAILQKWIEGGAQASPETVGNIINLLSKTLIEGLNSTK